MQQLSHLWSPLWFLVSSTIVIKKKIDQHVSNCPLRLRGFQELSDFSHPKSSIRHRDWSLKSHISLSKSSCLLSIHPFLDSVCLLQLGGRGRNAHVAHSFIHPVILAGKHPTTSLLVSSEHCNFLDVGCTLQTTSLNNCFYITSQKIVCSTTCSCVTCRCSTARWERQLFGLTPAECVAPESENDLVGLDYAGPFILKYWSICKPSIIKFCWLSRKSI